MVISWEFPSECVRAKMASGGGNAELPLSIQFASNRLTLYVKEKHTVEYVITKAAAALKEDREGMVMLFKGRRLNERAFIGVSEVL